MRLQPWQYVAAPFVIWAVVFLSLAVAKDDGYWAFWASPAVVVLAGLYVLSPQINWWWYRRNPPPLSKTAIKLLEEHFFYYKKLSPELKTRFRERVSLFIIGNEFIRPVRQDDSEAQQLRNTVPEELKAAVAAIATQISFGQKEVVINKFEHFILYPHPFPTPQYNNLHTSELYEEDGVVLLAADPLMLGLNNPQAVFSIGLYELANIFKKTTPSRLSRDVPSVQSPILTENDWSVLEKISGMTKATISGVVGLYDLDDFGILVHHFFTFSESFKTALPDLFQLLSNMFQQDPTNGMNPVSRSTNFSS
jgi:Mlc titration factor MtfA (ptsG expression regulator)